LLNKASDLSIKLCVFFFTLCSFLFGTDVRFTPFAFVVAAASCLVCGGVVVVAGQAGMVKYGSRNFCPKLPGVAGGGG